MTSSTSWPQNSVRQPKYWITGEPSVTPRTGPPAPTRDHHPSALTRSSRREQLEDDRHRRRAGGGALHAVEGAGEQQHPHVRRGRREDRADHRPEQPELVEPAVAEEVAGLAEEGRRHAEGEQRPGRGPGQHREVGVEVRLDRGQGHHEDGEGDVEREQPGQQRDQRPPLVAGAAARPGPVTRRCSRANQFVSTEPSAPSVPMAPPPGSAFGSRRTSDCSSPGLLHLGHPTVPASGRPSGEGPQRSRRPRAGASAQTAQAEPPVRVAPVGVEVVRDLAHHPVDRPLARRRSGRRPPGSAGPPCARRRSSGGVGPWCFHTTMGTPHTSQSATQHTSSSWCHSDRRAASQRSQSGSNGSATARPASVGEELDGRAGRHGRADGGLGAAHVVRRVARDTRRRSSPAACSAVVACGTVSPMHVGHRRRRRPGRDVHRHRRAVGRRARRWPATSRSPGPTAPSALDSLFCVAVRPTACSAAWAWVKV